MASSTFEFSRTTVVVSVLLLLGLLASNVALIIHIRTLNSSVQNGQTALAEGQLMAPVTGIDVSEQKQLFEWGKDNRKTLLMIFSPHCGYCQQNMPNWTAILQGIDKSAYRVVMISSISEGVKEYIDRYQIKDVPIIVEPEPKVLVDYQMYVTPQTILLGSDGKIERYWIGEITGEQKTHVEQSLNVILPK